MMEPRMELLLQTEGYMSPLLRETNFVLKVERDTGHSRWIETAQEGWNGRGAKQGCSSSLLTGFAIC